MRVINSEQLKSILAGLPSNPRIIASGNFSSPRTLLKIADEVIPEFKLHMLNAHGTGIPDREGITYETAFVGPAMRGMGSFLNSSIKPKVDGASAWLSSIAVSYKEIEKLAETEDIAKQTVEWYKKNETRYDSPAYRLSPVKVNGEERWVIYNQSTGKALKSINYHAVDLKKYLYQ